MEKLYIDLYNQSSPLKNIKLLDITYVHGSLNFRLEKAWYDPYDWLDDPEAFLLVRKRFG